MTATVYARAGDILDSAVGPDFVALNVKLGLCFGMEEVSAEVWRLLACPMTLGEICVRLRQTYDVDEQTCRADVGRLLGEMSDAGLVAIQAASTN